MNRIGRWIAAAAVAGLLGTEAADIKPPSTARELARLLNQAFIEVADEVSPAVVVIDVAQRQDDESDALSGHPWFDLLPDDWKERFRRETEERNERQGREEEKPEFNGQGSGMIMDSEGHILTNHHVVGNADRIRVRLRDGRQFDAEVRGSDEQSDLAVLELKNPPHDLPRVRFGDSDKVRVGEFAIAIGAPFRLDYTVTYGHVSAKGRNSVVPAMMGGGLMDQDFIQTDANINPGNSGGPLVNIEGEVIGINSMIRGLNSGIGFSIPSNLAREITARLIRDGRFNRSWLGINIGALRELEEIQSLVPGLADGVVITRIIPDGPASEADPSLLPKDVITAVDLLPKDVITAVDGKPVANPAELRAIVTRKEPGSVVQLDIHRAEKTFTAKVSPRAMPEELTSARPSRPRTSPASKPLPDNRILGMKVRLLSREAAGHAKVDGGFEVLDIEPDSPAARQGIQVGDIVTEVNHHAVTTPREFADTLKSLDAKKGVVFEIYRDGKQQFSVIKAEE